MEQDVIVVGSGAAALTASFVAAKAQLKVLLIEKTAYLGGTSAYSGGALWIPNNHYQKEAGIVDSREKAEQYLKGVLGNYYNAEKVEAYIDNAPEMLRYMEELGELKCINMGSVDYEPSQPGALSGRSLGVPAYDNKKLGYYRKKLRPALPQMTLFDGMQISFEDVGAYLSITKSSTSFFYAARLFARYVFDRLIYGRTTRSVNGNALVAELLASVVDAGVTIWDSSQVVKIVKEGERVAGVVVRRNGEDITIGARKGVVLATGGYGGNAKMRSENLPMAEMGWSLQPETNHGDGISLGESVGGIFVRQNAANGLWVPMSSRVGKDGKRIAYPHIIDRQMPGFLAVDMSGRRFVDETTPYQTFGNVMHEKNIERAFLIGDHTAVRKYGLGLALPAPMPIGHLVSAGYLKKAPTIPALAALLGLDGKILTETIETFNSDASEGIDPAFNRGQDAYSRTMGDQSHKPNPALGPLTTGPYYAVEIRKGELSTMNGLDTNAYAQVLDKLGEPIPGLYAVGIDANSMFRGTYPGGGSSLGPGMTFGFIAARHMAGVPPKGSPTMDR